VQLYIEINVNWKGK